MDESTITTTIAPPDNNVENKELNDVIKEELIEELNIYERCYLNH